MTVVVNAKTLLTPITLMAVAAYEFRTAIDRRSLPNVERFHKYNHRLASNQNGVFTHTVVSHRVMTTSPWIIPYATRLVKRQRVAAVGLQCLRFLQKLLNTAGLKNRTLKAP